MLTPQQDLPARLLARLARLVDAPSEPLLNASNSLNALAGRLVVASARRRWPELVEGAELRDGFGGRWVVDGWADRMGREAQVLVKGHITSARLTLSPDRAAVWLRNTSPTR